MIENAESSYKGLHVSRCVQTEKKRPREAYMAIKDGSGLVPVEEQPVPKYGIPKRFLRGVVDSFYIRKSKCWRGNISNIYE